MPSTSSLEEIIFEFRVLIIQHIASKENPLKKENVNFHENERKCFHYAQSEWVSEEKQAREENFLFIFRLSLRWIDSAVSSCSEECWVYGERSIIRGRYHMHSILQSLSYSLLRPKNFLIFFFTYCDTNTRSKAIHEVTIVKEHRPSVAERKFFFLFFYRKKEYFY